MESKKVHEVLDRLLANLNCPICLDLMKTPMVTKCEHSFCKHCILATLGTKTKVPCPLCKEQVTKRSLKPQETTDGIVSAVRGLITAYEMDKDAIWSPVKGPPVELDISMTPETSTSQPRTKNKMRIKDSKAMRKNIRNTRYGKKKMTRPAQEVIFLDDSTSESSRGSALKSHLNIRDGFPNVTSRKTSRKSTKSKASEERTHDSVGQLDDRQTLMDNDMSKPIKDILDGISEENPTQGKPDSSLHKKGNTSTESMAVAAESVSCVTDSGSVTENLQSASQNQKKSELVNVLSSCELGAQQASSEKEVEPSDGIVPMGVKKQVEKLLQCIEMDSHERSLCRKSKRKSNNRVTNALEFVRMHLKEGLSSLDGSGQGGNAEAESVARTDSFLDDIIVDDVPGYKSDISDNAGGNKTKGSEKAGDVLFAPSTSSKSSELDVFIPKTYSKKAQDQVTKSQFKRLENKQITSSEKVKKWMQGLVQDSPGNNAGRALKCLDSLQSTPSSDATILVGEEKKSEEECSIEDVNDDDTTDEIAIHASFCNESESDDNFDEGIVREDIGSIEGPNFVQKEMVSNWEDVNKNIVIGEPYSVRIGLDNSEVIMVEDEPSAPDSPLHKPAVAQRRRIFKSRPSVGTDQTLSKPRGNLGSMTIYKYGESQEDVDPYAFQMSQRTPEAKVKKSRSRSHGKEVKVKGVGKGKESDVPKDAEKVTTRSRSEDIAGSGANVAVPGERCVSPLGAGTKSVKGKSKGGRVKRAELSGRLGQVRRVQAKGSRHTDIGLFDLEDDTSDHEMKVDAGGRMVVLESAGEELPSTEVTTSSNGCESQDNLLITGKATSPWAAVQQEVKQYTRKSRSRSRGKKKLIRRSDGEVQEDMGEDRTDGVGKTEVAEVEELPEIKNLTEKISDAESFELDCMTFSQQIRDEEEVRRTIVTEKDKRLSTLEKSEREKMRRKKKGMGEVADAVGSTPESGASTPRSPFVVPETQIKSQSVGASAVQEGVGRTDVDLLESSQFKVPLPKVSKPKSVAIADLVGNSEKNDNTNVVILDSDDEEEVEIGVADSNDINNDDIRDGERDMDVIDTYEIQDNADSDTENMEQDQSVDEFPSCRVQVVAETPLIARPCLKMIDSPVKPEGGAIGGDCTPKDVEMKQDASASSIQVIAETPHIAGPQLSGSSVTRKSRRGDRASLHEKHLRTVDTDVREEIPPSAKRSRRSTSIGVTPEKCLEGEDTDTKKGISATLRKSRKSKSEMTTSGKLSIVDPKTLVVTNNKHGFNAPCSPCASNYNFEDDGAKHDSGMQGEGEFEFGVQDSASVIADTMESLGSPVEKRKRKTRRLKPLGNDKETVANANGKDDMSEIVTENRVASSQVMKAGRMTLKPESNVSDLNKTSDSAAKDESMFELGVQDSVSVIAETMESFDSPIEKKKQKPRQSKLLVGDSESAVDGVFEQVEPNDVTVIAETVDSIESSVEKIRSKIRRSRILVHHTDEIGEDAEVNSVKELNETCPGVSRSDENETGDTSAEIVRETQVSLEADENVMQSTNDCRQRDDQSGGCDSGKESVILVDDTSMIVQSGKEEIPVKATGEESNTCKSGSITEKESDTESIDLPSGEIEYEECDPSIKKSPVRAVVEELKDDKLLSGTMETEESLSMLQPKQDGAITKSSPGAETDLDCTLDTKSSTKRTVLSWSDSDDEIVFRKPKRKTFSLDTSPVSLPKKSHPATDEPNSLFQVGQSLGECLREINEETDNDGVEERMQQTSQHHACDVHVDSATEQTVPESYSGLQGLTHISDSAESSRQEMLGVEISESRSNRAGKEELELPLSSSSSKGQSLSSSSSRSQSGNSDVNTTGEIVPATPSASYFTTQPIKLDALLINEQDKSPENTGKLEKRSRLSRRSKKRPSDPPVDADVSSKKAEGNRESSTKPEVSADDKENEEKEESCKPEDTPQALAEGKQELSKKKGCKSRDAKVTNADLVTDSDLESGHVVVKSYTQFLKEVQNEEQIKDYIAPSESKIQECPELEEVGSCQNSREKDGNECPKFDDAESLKTSVEEEEIEDIVEDPLKTTPYFGEEDSEVEDDLDLLPSLPSANVGVHESEDEMCKDVDNVDVSNSGEIPASDGVGIRLEEDEMKPGDADEESDVAVQCSVQDYETNFADMNESNGDDAGEKAPDALGCKVKHDGLIGPDLSEADSKSPNENETGSNNDDLIPKTPLFQSRSFRKRGLKITKSIKNTENVTLGSSTRSDLVGQSSEDEDEPKTRRKSPNPADSQSQKASSASLKKDGLSKEQRTLNYEQTTLNKEQTTSGTEQTSSESGQTNSLKEQKTLESDQTSKMKKVSKDDEKDYSYLDTDEAVAKVYQNYYNTTPEVLLKHIKDEPFDSSQDCEVVKVEPAPSVQSDEDDDSLTADNAVCSVDSGDENIPDAVSTQGSCRTMNTTTSSEILPTQMREELEAEMAEIKAQMEAKRALMNDMSSERIDVDDPDENQSAAGSDEDLFDGPTPPPSPPSPTTSRTMASLNPSLAEDIQVLNRYRTMKTPDKHKKTPVKTRRKTSQNICKNMKTDDSDQCSDSDIVIQETPQKKIRQRIRCVSDSSSSDDGFENFIQKEKDSQRLPSQSWETLGLGKQVTQNGHSQGKSLTLIPDLGTEKCSQRQLGSREGQSQLGRAGLKPPTRMPDNGEDEYGKKTPDSQGSASMSGLKKSENKGKDGNFHKPTSTVSQSSRRLSSQFGSPCVIPDSVENMDKHEVASSQSRMKDRLLGASRKTILDSVSSSAETQEPSERVLPVRIDSNKITDSLSSQGFEKREKDFDGDNARTSARGTGVKRKSCEDQFSDDIMIVDADMWNEDKQDCDNSSLSDADGHVPKRLRQTTLEMSPVVYKTYDLGSQRLLKSMSAVPYVKTNVNKAESPLARDGPSGDNGNEKNHGTRHSEQKCLVDEGQTESPSQFGLTDVGENSPKSAPDSVVKSSKRQSPCAENFTGRQSPKAGPSENYDSQPSVVEIEVEDTIKTMSPRHTSVNVKQNLPSPHTRQGDVSECTTPKSTKLSPDLDKQRTTPKSVKQPVTTPAKQMTTSVKQTPTSVKQVPTPAKQTPESVKQTTTHKSVKQVITPKSLTTAPGELVDKENQLKRKAETGGEGLDDVDCQRKRVANMPHEGPWSSPRVRQLVEQMVEKQEAGNVSMSVSSPARAPLPMRRGRTFVVSGLNQTMKDVMTNFIESFGFIYSSKFSEKTTHVVVQTVEGQPCVCERTLKYFLGIAGRCWVVSLNWMIDSVQQGVCLPEDDYEIHGDTVNGPNHNGPFRARSAKRLLLERFEIYCHGQFTGMPISYTKLLILMLGAKLVNHPKEFTVDNPRCFIIAEPDGKLKKERYYDRLKEKFSAEVVSREWLLDNVAQYKIQNPRLYSLCDNALTKDN